jgi:hypothetical protein
MVLTGCVATADQPSPTDPHAVTTTTAPPTTTTTVTTGQALADFRDCLTGDGVIIEEITLDGRGRPRLARAMADVDFTDREVLDALEECGHELAGGALDFTTDPEFGTVLMARLEEQSNCLRQHGVEQFPLPDPSFAGIGSPYPVSRVPWTDPGLPEAMAACRES